MWKRSDVKMEKTYRVALCQRASGARSYALCEAGSAGLPEGTVFMTDLVPIELLLSRDLAAIAGTTRLTNGERFFVEAHGVWLMEQEAMALERSGDHGVVPWLNGLPPILPPR